MRQEESTEYVGAFVVGALVGIGAALLLAPKPPTRRERLMKELKPYRKKVRKKVARGTARARRAVNADPTGSAEKLLDVSRSVMDDMRDEVSAMVAEARAEIADAVADQLQSAQKRMKKTVKQARS